MNKENELTLDETLRTNETLKALELCITSLNAKICFSPVNVEHLKQRYDECKLVHQILSKAVEITYANQRLNY